MGNQSHPQHKTFGGPVVIHPGELTIFNSGGYWVWSPGVWCVMPEV